MSKICTKCKQEKNLSEFYNRKKAKDGKNSHCKICEHEEIYLWRKKNPERQALIEKKARYNRYGILLKDVPSVGLCPICLESKKLVLDHNHKTEKFRGFLCYNCNTLLGHIENEEKMKRVNKYLTEN